MEQLEIRKGKQKMYFDVEKKVYPGYEKYDVFALTMRSKASGKTANPRRQETNDPVESTQSDSPEKQS